MSSRRDLAALPPPYRRFHGALAGALPADRLVCDPLRTLAYGTDASFYRLVPRVVAQVRSADEVAELPHALTTVTSTVPVAWIGEVALMEPSLLTVKTA